MFNRVKCEYLASTTHQMDITMQLWPRGPYSAQNKDYGSVLKTV